MSAEHIDQRSRRALCFTPMETDRAVIVAASLRAEQLGYEAVIVPEGWGHDSGVLLAEIAMRTERIRLVAGVQSMWGRSDAQLAMEAASLADLSEGRFVLGLGASTPQLAVGLHDRRFTRPTARLAETLANVRRLLAGERIRLADGTEGLRLNHIPAQPVPIWVAGLGPQTSALARQHADGWFPALLPAAELRAGFGDDPGDGGEAELVIGPIGAVFDDADVARDVVCQIVGWYLTGMGRMYGDRLAAAGFHREVAQLRLANPSPRPGRIVWPHEVDVVLDEVAVHGDADVAAARLERWDSLADIVSVVAPPMIGDAVLDLVEAAAPRIAATMNDRSDR
jgi:alkanesulfonate monooxygenase SsuD/methylene tetrahydromethanopterin reductase-like flavin-dependent oxidoreductase (luciferase family)